MGICISDVMRRGSYLRIIAEKLLGLRGVVHQAKIRIICNYKLPIVIQHFSVWFMECQPNLLRTHLMACQLAGPLHSVQTVGGHCTYGLINLYMNI